MHLHADGCCGDVMKEYFVGIIAVVFVGGMIVSIAPGGTTQKYLRLLCGLSVMACIVMPAVSFFKGCDAPIETWGDLGEIEEYDESKYVEIYNNSLREAGAQNAENIIKNDMLKEFNADEQDFDIRLDNEIISDEIYISGILLEIHPSGVALDPRQMKKYLEDRLECPCTIVYS